MKTSKRVAALVLSAFSLIQPTFQPCHAKVNNDDHNSAPQSSTDEYRHHGPERVHVPYAHAISSSDFELCRPILERVDNGICKIVFQLLHSIRQPTLPAADLSELIDRSRLLLRLYSSPCYRNVFASTLTVLSSILEAVAPSAGPMHDQASLRLRDQTRATLAAEINSSIRTVTLLVQLPETDTPSYIGRVTHGHLFLSSLIQSHVADDLDVDLQRLTAALEHADAELRARRNP